jgi:hypothetical protein
VEYRRTMYQRGDKLNEAPGCYLCLRTTIMYKLNDDGDDDALQRLRYHIKPLAALAASEASELLLLDADAVLLQHPEAFFAMQGYGRDGLLLFRDYVRCLEYVSRWLLRCVRALFVDQSVCAQLSWFSSRSATERKLCQNICVPPGLWCVRAYITKWAATVAAVCREMGVEPESFCRHTAQQELDSSAVVLDRRRPEVQHSQAAAAAVMLVRAAVCARRV